MSALAAVAAVQTLLQKTSSPSSHRRRSWVPSQQQHHDTSLWLVVSSLVACGASLWLAQRWGSAAVTTNSEEQRGERRSWKPPPLDSDPDGKALTEHTLTALESSPDNGRQPVVDAPRSAVHDDATNEEQRAAATTSTEQNNYDEAVAAPASRNEPLAPTDINTNRTDDDDDDANDHATRQPMAELAKEHNCFCSSSRHREMDRGVDVERSIVTDGADEQHTDERETSSGSEPKEVGTKCKEISPIDSTHAVKIPSPRSVLDVSLTLSEDEPACSQNDGMEQQDACYDDDDDDARRQPPAASPNRSMTYPAVPTTVETSTAVLHKQETSVTSHGGTCSNSSAVSSIGGASQATAASSKRSMASSQLSQRWNLLAGGVGRIRPSPRTKSRRRRGGSTPTAATAAVIPETVQFPSPPTAKKTFRSFFAQNNNHNHNTQSYYTQHVDPSVVRFSRRVTITKGPDGRKVQRTTMTTVYASGAEHKEMTERYV